MFYTSSNKKEKRLSLRNAEIERAVARGAVKIERAGLDGVVVFDETNSLFYVKAWRGTAAKYAMNYYVKTKAHAEELIEKFFEGLKRTADYKAERKATKAVASLEGIKIGDIYYSSWGYSMTIVDFFQVVGFKGKKTLIIKELTHTNVESQYGYGKTMPNKDSFDSRSSHYKKGDDFAIARVNGPDSVKICSNFSSGQHLNKWDGTAKSFNHND